jgi:hypothetical protein
MAPDRWVHSYLSNCHGSSNVTSNAFQGEMMAATEKLHSSFTMNGNSGWRDHPRYYRQGTQTPPGSVNISPGWFPLGHAVSNAFLNDPPQLI